MLTTSNNSSSTEKCVSAVWIFSTNKQTTTPSQTLAIIIIFPALYKQIRKNTKTTSRLQWNNALIITICLILSGDIHQCPGLHHATPEERPVEEHTATVLQVCPLYDALQHSPVLSNLCCPSSLLGAAADGTLGSHAGAVVEVVDRHVRVSHASVGIGGVPVATGVGVGGVRRVLLGSRGTGQRDDFAGSSDGSCVFSGPSATTSKTCASRVPIVTQNVNKKSRDCEEQEVGSISDSQSFANSVGP